MVIQKAARRPSTPIAETTPRLPTSRLPAAAAPRTPGHANTSSFDAAPASRGGRYAAPGNGEDLRLGHGGPSVAELQQKLNAMGATPPLTADGKLGPKTQAMMQKMLGSTTLDAAARAKLDPAASPAAGSPDAEALKAQAKQLTESMTAPANPGPDATPQQQAQFQRDTARFGEMNDLAKFVNDQASQLPNPTPNGLTAPKMPGPDATPQQLAQFRSELLKFGAAAKSGSTTPTSATELADRAVQMMGQLTEPSMPGADASAQQLAQYERDTQRYDQMKTLAETTIAQTAGLPNPLPEGLTAPSLPGPDATMEQKARFQADLQNFVQLARG